ncbi:hypothetical protein BJY24_002801 [Nocardia transvalensis]|uniref:TnsA endonuclease-like protein n=1 Tax=Nocardia transvalensis TaxID=37333 RepID=A0A7W9PE13_9NOCA|nr:TnsA-like heteromeric transposase endonuclease subunit [Nocardia transvalensis]MBB5913934.1 hypothetical protein [Nocardia transvalensis]
MAELTSTFVSTRRSPTGEIARFPWDEMQFERFSDIGPWRTIRWYKGQQHYPGWYWSATEADLVLYESRLELANLLLCDFDRSVKSIAAQPFFVRTFAEGKPRTHVPDYLLWSDTGPIVMDVKPRSQLAQPKVAFTLGWVRKLVEDLGWRYEVASEPDAQTVRNVRFLAGFRRQWLFRPSLVEQLRSGAVDGLRFSDACRAVPGCEEPIVRATLLHLMWERVYLVDVGAPLRSSLVLRRKPVLTRNLR